MFGLRTPLMSIHYAHLVMLADRGIVPPMDARVLREALDAGAAPQIVLEATHAVTLQIVPLETLKKYAVRLQ